MTDAPADWLPAAFNDGWAYRNRVKAADLGPADLTLSAYYAARYPHSDQGVWRQRLAAGQVWRNGQQLWGDGPLAAGEQLVWHRPPWQEVAVPVLPSPLFDDGDLVVFNKPSGLQVLPAGGLLRHTVLGQLEAQVAAGDLDAGAGQPRPVHRLGRFTSGLLVCARSHEARAWLSAQLRESTAAAESTSEPESTDGAAAPLKKSATTVALLPTACTKVYRALLTPPPQGSRLAALGLGETCQIDTPIGRRGHPRLGTIWCADASSPEALPARSQFTLLNGGSQSWLFDVAIATGRPHQIRIHAAVAGAPLLGDPLYWPGGLARPDALPGDGGYRLHAHRFTLSTPHGRSQVLEAPLPPDLQCADDA